MRWKIAFCVLVAACFAEETIFTPGGELGFSFDDVPPSISPTQLRMIREHAEGGRKDSQYLMGLLLFYGHGTEKDAQAAFRYFRMAAHQNHVQSQLVIAFMLAGAHGVLTDDRAAVAWFERAANNGDPDAQWMLGRMHSDGRVPEGKSSPEEAVKHFRASAAQENPFGQFNLALSLEYGRGVPSDYAAARRYYGLASAQNMLEASFNLALMYLHARGGPADLPKGMELLKTAAMQGHARSQYYLGSMHTFGQGLPVDYDMALLWFTKALESEDESIVLEAKSAIEQIKPLVDQSTTRFAQVRKDFAKLNAGEE